MFLIGLLFLGVSEAKESWCMGNMFSAIGQTLIGSSVVSFPSNSIDNEDMLM